MDHRVHQKESKLLGVQEKIRRTRKSKEAKQLGQSDHVTGALHFTSREKLNHELGWESILERGNFLSVNIFQKIHLHETRPLIRNCMPKFRLENNLNLRNKNGYVPFPYRGEKFNSSFFPNTTKIWNKLPKNIQSQNMEDFKRSTKSIFKPPRYKHFSRGSKLGNILIYC